MKEFVSLPKQASTGNTAALFSYLYQMAEQINVALSALDSGEMSVEGKSVLAEAVNKPVEESTDARLSEIKAYIIKEATETSRICDELSTVLRSEYLATSQFGTYREEIENTITATAEALRSELNYSAQIAAVEAGLATLQEYYVSTNGYIKAGIIEYDSNNIPILGIAIGQDVTLNANGEIEKSDRFLSTYTARELAFWQNGVKIAYIADGKMYIGELTVTDKAILGRWEVTDDSSNGLIVKWNGG